MVDINDYIGKWSEKLSISQDDIKAEFKKLVEEENQLHKDLSDEDKQASALRRLALQYKRQLKSPAVGFEGMVVAVGDVVDTISRQRKEAKKMYEEDPQKAIADGVTDDDGNPLDTRKEWSEGKANMRYGKPLPDHNWLRTIYGIAVKSSVEGDTPKPFTINTSGDIARNEDIPVFKPVKFRAIDKTATEHAETNYTLNASMFTKFEIDETIKMPSPQEILSKSYSTVEITKLEEYHNANKEDYNRLAIVKGDVSMLVMEPTSVGSRRLIIEDGDNMDLDSRGITCWVPQRIPIDFAEGSRVLIIGRTSQGKKLDEQGNQTEEPGDMMMNVFSIFAFPEFKVKRDEPAEAPVETIEPKSEEQTTLDKDW